MKRTILIFTLTLLNLITNGQIINKIVPQFKFTQIDSITTVEIKKHSNNLDLFVSSVKWHIGSYFTSKDTNFTICNNYFQIYILYAEDNKYFIQQIDNFGYFKVEKVKAKNIGKFLKSHFNQMKVENLNPKMDTIFEVIDGVKTQTNIIQHKIDHQLWEQIKISYTNESLTYEYPADYSNNKYNLLTNKYKFLQLINDQQKKISKKKLQRVSVISKAINLSDY